MSKESNTTKSSCEKTGSPAPKRRKIEIPTGDGRLCMQSLPPEIMEDILTRVSVRDVLSFGASCSTYYQWCLSPSLWRRIFQRMGTAPLPSQPVDWRRMVILKSSQALHMQRLGARGRTQCYWPVGLVSMAISPPQALGYRRVLPTQDHELLLDYQGKLFLLRNNLTPPHRRASHATMLCNNVKDFAVDPRGIQHRRYVYILARPKDPPLGWSRLPASGHPAQCWDRVDVFQQDSGNWVFGMTFHPSLCFTQLRLTGPEVNRSLLLLTKCGKVHTLSFNETQLHTTRSHMTYKALRKISTSLAHLPITQIHTTYNSALYLTAEGSVYMEVHSASVHHQLFGNQQTFNSYDFHTPVPLPLPNKVVQCSLSQSHLCLVDEYGRVFMQGSNRYGQLGTGDKMDREQPTLVVLPLTPVEVWCGLNHTLALLQGESGAKEVHGCGCGYGSRLPGCSKGSAVFFKLKIQVPPATGSLCASKDCLYLLSCHDTNQPLLFRCPPSEQRDGDVEVIEKERLRVQLIQIRESRSLTQRIDMLVDAMTLSPTDKHFLVEALSILQQGPM